MVSYPFMNDVKQDRGWEQAESKCEMCNTYDLRGMWKCECEALNVNNNDLCWKCKQPRPCNRSYDQIDESRSIKHF
jgi:hypothetical protein